MDKTAMPSPTNSFLDSPSLKSKPNRAIGFTAILHGSPEAHQKIQGVIGRALAHFEDIKQHSLKVGHTSLTLWGRGRLEDCYHCLPDGSLLVLIGSPLGDFTWGEIIEKQLHDSGGSGFSLPWEGRVILLKIDAHSNRWLLWNDWLGSIPVFHVANLGMQIASTLEPAVVEASGFTFRHIHPPGLMALLLWGHYISDWTLYKDMKVIPPDCEATWDETGFRFTQLFSVKPSEVRWQAGWDDLVDEMYQLSRAAIVNALKQHERWILPLSSGLDSRLIAVVAAEIGADVRTYTWGRPRTTDVIHAPKIARALDLPWKYLNPGNTYLTAYQDQWADLFGSAMHFHGMYQMPFLDALRRESSGPILSGFIGECLAGDNIVDDWKIYSTPYWFQLCSDGWLHWTIDELRTLFQDQRQFEEHISELASEVHQLRESIPGGLFQQLNYLGLWGRQRHFTYFQSMLSDYWQGVATPYLDRNYARFSFSLPRAVLDDRRLLRAMLARYYPKVAVISGTYAPEPALLNGSFFLKKRVASYLPNSISQALIPGLYRSNSNPDIQCVVHDGKASFQPVFEKLDLLSSWLNVDVIEKAYRKILAENDGNAVRKLQSIQTLAYRL